MRRRNEPDLFSAHAEKEAQRQAPLAERIRPQSIDEFFGQQHLLGPGRVLRGALERGDPPSLILWGPPGSGKTTLARLIARAATARFVSFSAVLSGVADIRRLVEEARDEQRFHQRRTILFVDEIHRFNKAQQDAFLPHVENGTVVLIGATTENPSFEVIAPLLSRTRVLVLESLPSDALRQIIMRALSDGERGLGALGVSIADDACDLLIRHSQGDARVALNTLEFAATLATADDRTDIDLHRIEEASQRRALRYDRAGEEHHNVISAFIKSMRGSDPDASMYWMVRMLEAGEDPLFIARRMVIFAAEDIGNADPHALQVANAVKDAVDFVGLPEGRIPLAQGVTYLATAPKSNAALRALHAATADVQEHGTLPVPLEIRNAPTSMMKAMGYGADYQYPHDHDGEAVTQQYRPRELQGRRYYEPGTAGAEAEVQARMAQRDARRAPASPQQKKTSK
jgi:putative ATPase